MSNNLPTESSLNHLNTWQKIAIALVAVSLTLAVYLGLQTQTSNVSLDSQSEQSIPLEVALQNGKPTLAEFYADWCTSCQAMAADLAAIKAEYKDSVNFVMLNIDNSKWLPEMLRYRVDGIPHFIYLNQAGKDVAEAIGEQPRSVIEANLQALIAQQPLPYVTARGQFSDFAPTAKYQSPTNKAPTDPRSHGAQVKG